MFDGATDLMPVIVGALLAWGAGAVAAWSKSRTAHQDWLKEKRFEAHVDLLRAVSDTYRLNIEIAAMQARQAGGEEGARFVGELESLQTRMHASHQRGSDAIAVFELVGPDAVTEAGKRVLLSLGSEPEHLAERLTQLRIACQKALRIS